MIIITYIMFLFFGVKWNCIEKQYFDHAGRVLSGGLIYFYSAGTNVPIQVYHDAGTIPTTIPVVLDASGHTKICGDMDRAYAVTVTDANKALVWQNGYNGSSYYFAGTTTYDTLYKTDTIIKILKDTVERLANRKYDWQVIKYPTLSKYDYTGGKLKDSMQAACKEGYRLATIEDYSDDNWQVFYSSGPNTYNENYDIFVMPPDDHPINWGDQVYYLTIPIRYSFFTNIPRGEYDNSRLNIWFTVYHLSSGTYSDYIKKQGACGNNMLCSNDTLMTNQKDKNYIQSLQNIKGLKHPIKYSIPSSSGISISQTDKTFNAGGSPQYNNPRMLTEGYWNLPKDVFLYSCVKPTISKIDTVTRKDTINIIKKDTVNIIKTDTIKTVKTVRDTTVLHTLVHDTIKINVPFKDTVIKNVYKIDTLKLKDTVSSCKIDPTYTYYTLYNSKHMLPTMRGIQLFESNDSITWKNGSDNKTQNDFTKTVSIKIEANTVLDIAVYIYDNTGVFVNSFEGKINTKSNNVKYLTWGGMTAGGKRVVDGVYVIRVLIRDGNRIANNVYKVGVER